MPTLVWCLFKALFLQKSVGFIHGYSFSHLNQDFSKPFFTVSTWVPQRYVTLSGWSMPLCWDQFSLTFVSSSLSSLQHHPELPLLQKRLSSLFICGCLSEHNKQLVSAQTLQLPLLSRTTHLHWTPVNHSKASWSWTICPTSSICLPPAFTPFSLCVSYTQQRCKANSWHP